MKYNDNKKLSPWWKKTLIRVLVIISFFVIAFVLWVVLIPSITTLAVGMDIKELLASITLFITLSTVIVKLSEKVVITNYEAKRKISLSIKTVDEYATITCSIENFGTKRIIPQNIYLMVESGTEESGQVAFPYLLKHEEGEFDCIFAKQCKAGGFISIPDSMLQEQFKHCFRKIIKLEQLSKTTILFIDPGETFSEDVTLKLEAGGIYKVTAVWTSVKEDCICTTKEFVVPITRS